MVLKNIKYTDSHTKLIREQTYYLCGHTTFEYIPHTNNDIQITRHTTHE